MSAPAAAAHAREELFRLVAARTGLDFPAIRRRGVEAAVRRAMARSGVADDGRYLALVRDTGAAFDDLVEELTVGETYFFRDPGQLEVIRREVLPPLLGRSAGVRMWSAGSATGEEAYSLAVLVHEAGAAGAARIVATDIARDRLARAERARYGRWSLRGVPAAVVERYFRREQERYALTPEIRRMVEFRHLNLAADVYPSAASGIREMDVILCRNVLIYLDRATIATIARRLLASLAEDGWLFLGANDPLIAELVPCEVVVTEAGLAYRRVRGPREAAPSAAPRTAPAAHDPPADLPLPPIAPRLLAATATPRPPTRDPHPAPRPDGDDAEACVRDVRSLAAQGRFHEAGRACAAALDRHRGSSELLYLHSLLLTEAGRYPEAARAARSALYLDRSLVVAHVSLGVARARQRDAPGARRALGAADRLLSSMPPEAVVPASGGESAEALLAMVRAQLRVLDQETSG